MQLLTFTMISAIIYSTLALTQAGLALAAPGPRPTPVARNVLPRFLREAHMLPERGIMEDGVIIMPVRRMKGQGRKTKRQNIVQVPIADDGGDEDYVQFYFYISRCNADTTKRELRWILGAKLSHSFWTLVCASSATDRYLPITNYNA